MGILFSQVAQTRITFNEKQLLQLIHQHLLSKNLTEAAGALLKEAGLPPLPIKQPGSLFPPYRSSNTSATSAPTTPGRTNRASSHGSSTLPGTPAIAGPSTSALTPNVQVGQPLKLNLSARYGP